MCNRKNVDSTPTQLFLFQVLLQKKEFSNTQGIRFWGNSFAFGSQGELLAQADSHTQHTLLVDIDFKRSEEVRRMWPFLRDRRIEAFDPLLKRFCD